MGDRYSFTSEGLDNIRIYGVKPGEVWEALHSKRRLVRQIDARASAMFGLTHTGRYLVVFVLESAYENNDWDVIAAREMFPDEKAVFDRYTGRK
ncbi:hypothetical protein [Nocardia sp. NPDC020380]|uniref:hypothetical protein n=1 Tax=Nocardia sp. NPDC020380 TaxID=3364309 RepID=UPI00379ECF24